MKRADIHSTTKAHSLRLWRDRDSGAWCASLSFTPTKGPGFELPFVGPSHSLAALSRAVAHAFEGATKGVDAESWNVFAEAWNEMIASADGRLAA